MIKENIIKKIENNNLTEEEKKEVIQIIELYSRSPDSFNKMYKHWERHLGLV